MCGVWRYNVQGLSHRTSCTVRNVENRMTVMTARKVMTDNKMDNQESFRVHCVNAKTATGAYATKACQSRLA